MKYIIYIIFGLAIILLFAYYILTGLNIFLWVALAFIGILILNWWLSSMITYDWKTFTVKKLRSGFYISLKKFSNGISYQYTCDRFNRIEKEIHVNKVVGMAIGLPKIITISKFPFIQIIHANSIRTGFRRYGDVLHSVLYLRVKGKIVSIDTGISYFEGDVCQFTPVINRGVLFAKLENLSTHTLQVIKYPVSFKWGWGYTLMPYGCPCTFAIRKK